MVAALVHLPANAGYPLLDATLWSTFASERNVRTMKLVTALATAIAAIATVTAPALAARETTQPGLIYTIPAVLTNDRIELTETHIPRGTTIRYTIVNHGTRAYSFRIGETTTLPIPPQGRTRVRINWERRGRYLYGTYYRGRPAGPSGYITVI